MKNKFSLSSGTLTFLRAVAVLSVFSGIYFLVKGAVDQFMIENTEEAIDQARQGKLLLLYGLGFILFGIIVLIVHHAGRSSKK